MTSSSQASSNSVRLLTEHHPDGTTRWLDWQPAYDRRSEGYGVHGVEMVFGIQRDQVAVTWTLMTPWMLPKVYQWWAEEGLGQDLGHFDGLGSVDYHSSEPRYEGQFSVDNCRYTGGKCYCNGSTIAGRDLFAAAVEKGPEAIWSELKEWLERAEANVKQQRQDRQRFS